MWCRWTFTPLSKPQPLSDFLVGHALREHEDYLGSRVVIGSGGRFRIFFLFAKYDVAPKLAQWFLRLASLRAGCACAAGIKWPLGGGAGSTCLSPRVRSAVRRAAIRSFGIYAI